jgi:hypothetical protein
MSFFRSTSRALALGIVLALTIASPLMQRTSYAQETTGGLQGTVKDANGAVVPKATVELSSPSLVGEKKLRTDGTGYYRFANIPPGTYAVLVKAEGFATVKRDGITIEVGHLPTLDLVLKVGSASTVVEVTGEAPLIDVTTTRTVSNITEDVIADVPHGRSFQSVIQFAPSARNEPLAGSGTYGAAGGTGSGGTSPGNGGNGGSYGFSVAGGADSENSYLVEGQDTANLIGGFSHTNVPFEFIQEVQIKTSGIEAEHGGALGGVVNVIMKRGSNAWHGQFGISGEFGGLDGSPTAYTRFDPNGSVTPPANDPTGPVRLDYAPQYYQSKKDHTRDMQPSFSIGGPLVKDRVFAFLGFAPQYTSQTRTVDFGANDGNAGLQTFNRDTQTYYATARVDAKLSSKLSVFGSWLSQYQRETGENLPFGDSTTGLVNVSAASPLTGFEHGYGFASPNTTINVGGDFTLTPRLISTTRLGYYFENYHDFGFPTAGTIYLWQTAGTTGQLCTPSVLDPTFTNDPVAATCGGAALNGDATSVAAGLVQPNGYFTAGNDQNYTLKNSNKHIQFDQDLAWFKSGWAGTHNLKFGYQLNRISNDIYQRWNAPAVEIFPGSAAYSYLYGVAVAGPYGAATVNDFGTRGKATSYNHAFFAQDSWTIGKGVTIVAGIRVEKENVPAENNSEGLQAANPINFGWGDKIAPRLGFAWDVFRDGKLKVFGSHGVFNDQMKLNLAISSFGGQYWDNCTYELFDPNFKDIVAAPDANSRYCNNSDGSLASVENLQALLTPTNSKVNGQSYSSTQNVFIENINFRGNEGVVNGLKPYRQHEEVLGTDFAIRKNLAFEARWDRRRLDRVIEDAALFSNGSENFQIVNPGYGPNATNTFCGSLCPPNIKAARSYDGLELRLTKSFDHNWYGMFSYTYSKLRGNYAGLTSTDLADGGGGRNSPNNSRAFDETYFQWDAYGKSSSGPLATDRPNTFKGYTYYQLPWSGKRAITNIGLFQTFYEGTASSSYLDVGAFGGYPVYPEGRGKWTPLSQDPNSGIITAGPTIVKRTPWYIQSDVNLSQDVKINKNNEAQVLGFEVTVSNLFNQRSVTSYNSAVNSPNYPNQILPGGLSLGSAAAYSAYEHAYPWKTLLNDDGVILNSTYGLPRSFQAARTVRFTLKYTF